MSYFQIPDNIDFELPDGQAESTIGDEDNAIYFLGNNLQPIFASPFPLR